MSGLPIPRYARMVHHTTKLCEEEQAVIDSEKTFPWEWELVEDICRFLYAHEIQEERILRERAKFGGDPPGYRLINQPFFIARYRDMKEHRRRELDGTLELSVDKGEAKSPVAGSSASAPPTAVTIHGPRHGSPREGSPRARHYAYAGYNGYRSSSYAHGPGSTYVSRQGHSYAPASSTRNGTTLPPLVPPSSAGGTRAPSSTSSPAHHSRYASPPDHSYAYHYGYGVGYREWQPREEPPAFRTSGRITEFRAQMVAERERETPSHERKVGSNGYLQLR